MFPSNGDPSESHQPKSSSIGRMTGNTSADKAQKSWKDVLTNVSWTTAVHFKKHAGVGAAISIAYFDPGNWGVDLQAGAEHGYRLLFVVLLAGLLAVYFQILASRLGCVTGLDLAAHCRLLLHSRPKHRLVYRWCLLYPLYFLSEAAIIATDLAELIGSAIALCMIFPRLPLWGGVLITAFDVFIILAMGDPLRGKPVRLFEFVIAAMVLAVLICMCVIITKIDIDWNDAFEGYLPSRFLVKNGAVYIATGIIGATVMPHSIFLGSALATQDRISFNPPEPKDASEHGETEHYRDTLTLRILKSVKKAIWSAFKTPPLAEKARTHGEWNNNPFEFVKAHLYHGIADVVLSLLGFAVLINSMILIMSSSVFFYNDYLGVDSGIASHASLFDAYDLIQQSIGKGPAYLFAFGLLFAGQSSSIIATVAGQAVSEGFLHWRVSPFLRRFVTRVIGLVPAMVVALAFGRRGIDDLLVASQVALSIVLPFIILPLLLLTSSKSVMSVRKNGPSITSPNQDPSSSSPLDAPTTELIADEENKERDAGMQEEARPEREELVDFSNKWYTTAFGFAVWLFVIVANVYTLVTL